MQRIPGLEMAIYAHGRADNQDYCSQHPTTGANLIELGTFLKYEKQLRNLQLQESRPQRRYEKEMAETAQPAKGAQATGAASRHRKESWLRFFNRQNPSCS